MAAPSSLAYRGGQWATYYCMH